MQHRTCKTTHARRHMQDRTFKTRIHTHPHILTHTPSYLDTHTHTHTHTHNSFHKTSAAQSHNNPVWNETFEFAVQPLLMQGMLLTLTVEDFSVSTRPRTLSLAYQLHTSCILVATTHACRAEGGSVERGQFDLGSCAHVIRVE